MKQPGSQGVMTRCQQQLAGLAPVLHFDTVTSLADLIGHVAVWRQRAIELLAFEMPLQMDGLWVATATTDYIIYASNATALAQDHAICHELGHICMGHRSQVDDVARLVRGVPLVVDAEHVMAMRSSRTAAIPEQEAECFALLLAERLPFDALDRIDITPLPAVGPAERAWIERYVASLFSLDRKE